MAVRDFSMNERVYVFSDGSISPAVMTDIISSEIGPLNIGRTLVVIPSMDYGILRQIPEPFADVGMADAIEAKSIEDAERVCLGKNINNYIILNDNVVAVTHKNSPNVQWFRGMHYSTRVNETDTANSVNWSSMMLARLTAYPSYCRQSKRRGTKRRPTALNAELYRMFISRQLEFHLSNSILWGNIKRLVDSKLTLQGALA